uniref:EamA domain-containing protein n=1 Tax=Quercus lobata TaxID=97700 RepID=A0A7N2QZC0_QUELO
MASCPVLSCSAPASMTVHLPACLARVLLLAACSRESPASPSRESLFSCTLLSNLHSISLTTLTSNPPKYRVSAISFDSSNFTLWGSGEWWMLLAAQSMAIGTVMVRWVSKYSDPIMATGWHMVIGGLPLVTFSILNHDPAVTGSLKEFTANDVLALLYTSIFGSAVSYGVFFYNATKGSLTKLSSLTFLTPMFASIFGFIYLGETFSPLQLVGAVVTLVAIYMVNYRNVVE